MKAVVFNPVSVADLEEILDYIATDNPMAAEAVREEILVTAEQLGEQPCLGIRPRFSAPRFQGIRFLPVRKYSNYLIFYQERETEVEVLRIFHGARNLPPLFE